jgi:hypothetical protein
MVQVAVGQHDRAQSGQVEAQAGGIDPGHVGIAAVEEEIAFGEPQVQGQARFAEQIAIGQGIVIGQYGQFHAGLRREVGHAGRRMSRNSGQKQVPGAF